MKIVETVVLLSRGAFAQSNEWIAIRDTVHAAIAQAEWPIGAGNFIIHPQSGKKSGEGNGVVPIKAKPMAVLQDDGWTLEYPWEVATKSGVTGRGKGSKPGNIDAAKLFPEGLVVVEWETGNISSSHRAINKMALGLVVKKCVAGILVIPNMKLAQYLTDRIGNIERSDHTSRCGRTSRLRRACLNWSSSSRTAKARTARRFRKARTAGRRRVCSRPRLLKASPRRDRCSCGEQFRHRAAAP